MLGDGAPENWQADILKDLQDPKSPVTWLNAIGWRIRRNYLWLYSALLFTWIIKLDFMEGQVASVGLLVARASVGRIPGWITVLCVATFYLILAMMAIVAGAKHRLDED
jgi:uncharacterized membrane protein